MNSQEMAEFVVNDDEIGATVTHEVPGCSWYEVIDGDSLAAVVEAAAEHLAWHRQEARRCDALARKGTGVGACDRPLDRHGDCDRPASHVL